MAEEEKKAAVERKPRGRKPKTESSVAVPADEESAVKRTTRGRKPKTKTEEAEVSEVSEKNGELQAAEAENQADAAVTDVTKAETTVVSVERKPRGRKPKVEVAAAGAGADTVADVAQEEMPAAAVERKPRGRKPKMEVAAEAGADTVADAAKAEAPADVLRKLRGRKPKAEVAAEASDAGEENTPKRTARGRKPKTEESVEPVAASEKSAPQRTTYGWKSKTEALAEATAEAAADSVTDVVKEETPAAVVERKPRGRKPKAEDVAETAAVSESVKSVENTGVKTSEAVSSVAQAGKTEEAPRTEAVEKTDELDNETQRVPSGNPCGGILEVMQEGFGFTRSENFMPGDSDVYVNPAIIKRYRLKTGDVIHGLSRAKNPNERYAALSYIETVNGKPLSEMFRRRSFESLTPIFPNQRIRLEVPGEKTSTSLRILDLLAPIGKGQRGMIVSPPKAGKTTLLKQVAKAIVKNEPKMHLLILLIDERPEEVTDMKEEVVGGLVTVIYSTFDEVPEHHKRVAEMTIERAKRLVEQGEDVTILLDSITRLARAYNLVVPASGRTLSGGLDPAALHMPKRFFGAARNMREGGSLTILSTALVETGSRMDDVIYEEFKGTGNMELVLNRELQERRIFPAIDIVKSGTRRDDLLLSELEQRAVDIIHKRVSDEKASSAEEVIQLFERTSSNEEVCQFVVNGKAIPSTGARMNSGIRSNTNLSTGPKSGFGTGSNTKPGLNSNSGTKTDGNPNSGTQKTGVKPGSNPNSRLAIKINR